MNRAEANHGRCNRRRALHVLGVVIWIGGVAMVTMVVLPALQRGDLGSNPLQVFGGIERRFAWHARIATVIVGLTGFYMTQRLDLWIGFGRAGSGGCTPWCTCGCCSPCCCSWRSRRFCIAGSTHGLWQSPMPLLPCCNALTGCCSH
jgi:hypothetical protein